MAKKVEATGSIGEKAQEGIRLYREINKKKERLKEIKADLRGFAEEMVPSEEEPVELVTAQGVVQIVFVSDSYYVTASNTDSILALKDNLGDLYNKLFSEETKINTDDEFEEKIFSIPASVRKELMEYVTKRNNPPRVKFPK